MLALWDSPRQREAYTWFALELANLRAAFRWAADHGDLDSAADHRLLRRRSSVSMVEQYEPVAWAEELIEPAEAVDHRRLAQLYVIASQCYAAGRIDRCCPLMPSAGLVAIGSGRFDEVPFDFEAAIVAGLQHGGPPGRCGRTVAAR